MKICQAVQKLLVGDRQTAIFEWSRSPLMPLSQYEIKEYDIEVAFNVITSI
jgi:hypothetical protein